MSESNQPQQFVILWTLHARRVYAYILTLVPHWADAEDIFQETSLTLWEKIGEFEMGTDFGAWACRIARFKTLSHLQRKSGFESRDEHFLNAVETQLAAMGGELEERFSALEDCLAKLNPSDRKLIELRYREDVSVKQVASEVGRSTLGIYKSLRRIHDLLFDCIQRRLAQENRS